MFCQKARSDQARILPSPQFQFPCHPEESRGGQAPKPRSRAHDPSLATFLLLLPLAITACLPLDSGFGLLGLFEGFLFRLGLLALLRSLFLLLRQGSFLCRRLTGQTA